MYIYIYIYAYIPTYMNTFTHRHTHTYTYTTYSTYIDTYSRRATITLSLGETQSGDIPLSLQVSKETITGDMG